MSATQFSSGTIGGLRGPVGTVDEDLSDLAAQVSSDRQAAQDALGEAQVASASAGASLASIISTFMPVFADDPYFNQIVFTNTGGQILFGLDPFGQVINAQVQSLPMFADDPLYNQSLVIDPNGRVVAQLDGASGALSNIILPTLPIFADDPFFSASVIVDAKGTILASTTGLTAESYRDFTAAVFPDGGVYLVGPAGSTKLAAPQAIAYGPSLRSDVVRWSDGTATDGSSFRRIDLNGLAKLPPTVTNVLFFPMSSQSLGNGTNGSPIVSATPPAPGKVLAFGGWARPMQDVAVGAATPTTLVPIGDEQLAPLADLYERFAVSPAHFQYFGETQGGGFAAFVGGNLPANTVAVFGAFGVGGASITQLNKGTNPYKNMIRAVERLAVWCALSGRALSVPAFLWDQSFQDVQALTTAAYRANVVQLQSDFNGDVNALLTSYGFVLNASGQIPMLCWQESNASKAGVSYSDLAGVYVDLTIQYPTKFSVIGPQYWNGNLSPTDFLHYLGPGYRLFGEYLGRAAIRFAASASAGALFMTQAVNNGTAITITTNAATALVLDSIAVTDPGQYGLILIDDTDPTNATTIALSGIAVSGLNKITATAASALTPGRSYSIGMAYYLNGSGNPNVGPTSGPRACFRDSSPDTFSALAGGGRMFNWACHQRLHFNAA